MLGSEAEKTEYVRGIMKESPVGSYSPYKHGACSCLRGSLQTWDCEASCGDAGGAGVPVTATSLGKHALGNCAPHSMPSPGALVFVHHEILVSSDSSSPSATERAGLGLM